MADEQFQIRTSLFPPNGEGGRAPAALNKLGVLIVADLFDQLVLSGYAYHMQIGTEDAPVNATTSIDDQLASGVCDNNDDYAMIPLLYEVNFDFVDTAVNSDIMLEWDKLIARYSSGGTAFTPANLRGDRSGGAQGAFVVGPDVTIAAKSAVPNTVELARRAPHEDVVTDPTTGKMNHDPVIYSCRQRPIVCGIDSCSFVLHAGSGTADINIYAAFQFAQFLKSYLV